MRRDVLNSPRLREIRKNKTRVARHKVILFFLGIFAIYGLLGLVARAEKINIKSVSISGNQIVGASLIENKVWEEISGNYLFIFPKTNFLIYPKNKIVASLRQEFSRLDDVHVSLNDVNALYVTVTERSGEYTWCGKNIQEGEDVKCFFMDSGGVIFDEAPYFSGDIYFKFFGEVSGDVPGARYYGDIFNRLILFKENLERMGLHPKALFIKPDGDIEITLASVVSEPKIRLTVEADFEKVIENLQTAITTDPLQKELEQKYSSLEYIDLRFGNKVYYRFK